MMHDSDGQPTPLNPFAPTSHLGSEEHDPAGLKSKTFSARRIIGSVIGAVTISGGLFGVLLSTVVVGTITLSRSVSEVHEAGFVFLYAFPLSILVGVVAAGLVSIVLVPLCFLLRTSLAALQDQPWDRRSVFMFGRICGFLCGLVAAVFLGGFGLTGAMVGLIPGGFSAVVTPLLLRRVFR
ncbi:hypothetical protein [Stieleria mannarensis]|uniref:hypothetical protein n=1 Tax=Stieleria mannarensis TaxID=2755585 RepID=UPI0016005DCA|nr:hypothetical protein [Rhodopirellula sp. JC639]